jgi:hypothetical protein
MGDYSGSGCTVNFTPDPSEPLAMGGSGTLMGVASGRVWGNVSCTTATAFGGQPSVCSVLNAEFKFEDCSE